MASGSFIHMVIRGDADPTSTATPAALGYLYLRSNGSVYIKTGAGDTAWSAIVTVG